MATEETALETPAQCERCEKLILWSLTSSSTGSQACAQNALRLLEIDSPGMMHTLFRLTMRIATVTIPTSTMCSRES
jgi:hypothetical protein